MSRVLVVEDSESKLLSIRSVLSDIFGKGAIDEAFSVRSAIDKLSTGRYEVIIADMSLPTFDIKAKERGGSPRPFGGIEVFETLEKLDILTPVIVVTSYPELAEGKKTLGLSDLSKELKRDFPDNFIATIHFDSSVTNWERELRDLVGKIIGE